MNLRGGDLTAILKSAVVSTVGGSCGYHIRKAQKICN